MKLIVTTKPIFRWGTHLNKRLCGSEIPEFWNSGIPEFRSYVPSFKIRVIPLYLEE